jgi:molybdate transport system substrate-binding protein
MRTLIGLLLLFAAVPADAAEVRIAAASDLNFAIKEIVAEFEKQTGHKVLLTLGSSGNFFAQIANGAPFDVYLSADIHYPRELEKAGHTIPGSIFVYGIGRIALWSSKVDPERGMQLLLDPSVKRIAIANPQHAPYGKAAVAAMQHAKVYDRVKDKLVLGENISQAAQFVQSGAADVGVLALALALSEPMMRAGRFWTIPVESYPRMEQGAVLTRRAGTAAREFMDWLRSPASKKILERYGFALE